MALPADLRAAVAALADRTNVCNLVSVGDLADALPTRVLTSDEVRALVAALADHGLHLIEPDAEAVLSGRRQA